MEGGVTRAAAVATCALVRARGDVLVGVAALPSRAACRFLMHSCLAESVGMMVGVTLLCTLGTVAEVKAAAMAMVAAAEAFTAMSNGGGSKSDSNGGGGGSDSRQR